MSISNTGNKAEERFCEITAATGLKKSDPRGDAFINIDEEPRYVEVKKVGKSTANQVRPYKYLPLVIWHAQSAEWYVMPPQDIVEFAKSKSGQHALVSFVCCSFGKAQWKKEKYSADKSQLRNKVLKAIADGDSARAHKLLMEMVKPDAEKLQEKYSKILEEGLL